jgi:hypothetical protein
MRLAGIAVTKGPATGYRNFRLLGFPGSAWRTLRSTTAQLIRVKRHAFPDPHRT